MFLVLLLWVEGCCFEGVEFFGWGLGGGDDGDGADATFGGFGADGGFEAVSAEDGEDTGFGGGAEGVD